MEGFFVRGWGTVPYTRCVELDAERDDDEADRGAGEGERGVDEAVDSFLRRPSWPGAGWGKRWGPDWAC